MTKVDIQLIEKTNVSMQLVIRGVDVPFMNALRRIMMAEVPSMAVDDVVIVENSSVLHDEILAHRLGLVPLVTDLDSYNLPEKCTCKSEFGCNLCRVTLTLEAEASESIKTIYTGDLKSEDPHITPVSVKIPLVKLAPGQKIKLEAYARLGTELVHAKWQPVSVCAYKYLPQINIDEKLCTVCEECVKVCSKKILVRGETKIVPKNTIECTLCQDCVKVCTSPPALNVAGSDDSFVLNIETDEVLPPERIVLEALNILNGKIDDLLGQLTPKK
jgi:DNA-directed RNA polymerase subunit D